MVTRILCLFLFCAFLLAVVNMELVAAPVWVSTTTAGPGDVSHGVAVAADATTKLIFAAGTIYPSGMCCQAQIVIYDPATGNQLAQVAVSLPGVTLTQARDIAADSLGNFYVAGEAEDSNGTGMLLMKFDSSGTLLWHTISQVIPGSAATAYSLSLDGAGNVSLIGTSWSINADYAVIKFDPNGSRIWAATYDRAGGFDFAFKGRADRLGNVYLTGMSSPSTSNLYDMTTVMFDKNGAFVWESTYAQPGDDLGMDIRVDTCGNVYVTGQADGGNGFVTIRYDGKSGTTIWSAYFPATGYLYDEPVALALNESTGRIYVLGRMEDPTYSTKFVTLAYDRNGSLIWSQDFTGGGGPSYPFAITLDACGNVYVSGDSNYVSTSEDMVAVVYDSMGAIRFVQRSSIKNYDLSYAMTLDWQGNLYLTGYSFATYGQEDFATMMFRSLCRRQPPVPACR